jgi:hypothetical protein
MKKLPKFGDYINESFKINEESKIIISKAADMDTEEGEDATKATKFMSSGLFKTRLRKLLADIGNANADIDQPIIIDADEYNDFMLSTHIAIPLPNGYPDDYDQLDYTKWDFSEDDFFRGCEPIFAVLKTEECFIPRNYNVPINTDMVLLISV